MSMTTHVRILLSAFEELGRWKQNSTEGCSGSLRLSLCWGWLSYVIVRAVAIALAVKILDIVKVAQDAANELSFRQGMIPKTLSITNLLLALCWSHPPK